MISTVAVVVPWVAWIASQERPGFRWKSGSGGFVVWAGLAAVIIQATSLPLAVVQSVADLGVPFRPQDVIAIVSGAVLAFHRPPLGLTRYWNALRLLALMVMTLGLGLGFARGNSTDALLREGLLQARFFSAVLIVLVALSLNTKRTIRFLLVSISASALILVLSIWTGLAIDGQVAQVDALSGGTNEPLGGSLARYQSGGSTLALFFLAAALAWALAGKRLPTSVKVTLVPALLITGLNFSRHSVVVLAMAGLVAVLLNVSAHRMASVVRVGLSVGLVTVLAVALTSLAPTSPVSERMKDFVEAFNGRVISGLINSESASDSSLRLRDVEREYAFVAAQDKALIGGGFGFAYRPPIDFGSGTFWRADGRTYVHDTYLWLAVKLGLIGVAAYAALVFYALAPRRRAPKSAAAVSAVAVLFAALVISFWVPLLLDPRGGVPVAAAVVAVVAWTRVGGPAPATLRRSGATATWRTGAMRDSNSTRQRAEPDWVGSPS